MEHELLSVPKNMSSSMVLVGLILLDLLFSVESFVHCVGCTSSQVPKKKIKRTSNDLQNVTHKT